MKVYGISLKANSGTERDLVVSEVPEGATVADLSAALGEKLAQRASQEVIWLALERLERAKLLEAELNDVGRCSRLVRGALRLVRSH